MDTSKAPKTLLEAVAYFSDEDKAEAFVAELRWPEGEQVCQKCGSVGAHYRIKSRRVWKCRDCRKTFSTKLGTIFEDSPLSFSKWIPALWMIANCKNGISSYELHRALGVTQKTAWFMLHRIREAMNTGTFEKMSGTCEADETYIGGRFKNMHISKRKRIRETMGQRGVTGGAAKTAVLGVLQRGDEGTSKVSAKVVSYMKGREMQAEIRNTVEDGSTIYTDSDGKFHFLRETYTHDTVNHAREYVRGHCHSNGIENFWALLKRTIKGTYTNVSPAHTSRYVDEQAFRFNEREDNDKGRFITLLGSIFGKRLTYAALVAARR